MKLSLLILLVLFGAKFSFAQFDWSFNAVHNSPSGKLAPHISPATGIGMGFSIKPFKKPGLWVSLDGSIVSMVSFDRTLTLTSPASPEVTTTTINYNTNADNLALALRYEFRQNKKWNPYISTSLMHMWFKSSISIVDPQSEDGCEYLEEMKVEGGGQWMFATGGGIKYKLNKKTPASEDEHLNNIWIDFSVNFVRGPQINYADMRSIQTMQPGELYKPANPEAKPLGILYRDIHTNTTHEHHIVEIHNNPFRMVQFKLGLVLEGTR
jgi:hypothetical protein